MKEIDEIFNKYNLTNEDRNYLEKIIIPIVNNEHFKKRMTSDFLHHGNITLGTHIIEDTIETYLMSKKYLNKHNDSSYQIDLAVKIALLHDLYTIPWQNNKEAHVNHFFNKHGFRHPVEAAINAIIWYPDFFKDDIQAKILIDGIIHHMYPLPVRIINDNNINKVELKNIDNYYLLPFKYKEMIIDSLNRKKIGKISFSKSKYQEGKIMSKADKKVSRKEIRNFASAKALLTGHNKKLNKKDR